MIVQFVCTLLYFPVSQCSLNTQFDDLWNDVVSKINSEDNNAGIGLFDNAAVEFGESSKEKRYEYFVNSHKANEKIPTSSLYTTKLNYFSLMNEEERSKYLSSPGTTQFDILDEIRNFLLQPGVLAELTPVSFETVAVRSRHSGAYQVGGVMTGVMMTEYLSKVLAADLDSGRDLSSQYFLNCISPDSRDYIPKWPHEIWTKIHEEPVSPSSLEMKWTHVKEGDRCQEDFSTNAVTPGITVEKNHMMYGSKYSMEAYLLRTPLTICIQVDTTKPSFFFYSGGLYTDLMLGGLFRSCNHFAVLLNYQGDFFLLHNTWGTDWGIQGMMHVSRHHLTPYEVFTLSYPVMVYEEVEPPTDIINTSSQFNRVVYETIWQKENAIHHKDYHIPSIAVNQSFVLICSELKVPISKSKMSVQLMTRHPKKVGYGISVNFNKMRVIQFSANDIHLSTKQKISQDMMNAEISDSTFPNSTLRIKIGESSIQTFLNDIKLLEFSFTEHLDFGISNYIEAAGDGTLQILHQTERIVSSSDDSPLTPLSGTVKCEVARDNKGNDADCALWREYGYCEEMSKYHEYVKDNCMRDCGVCG